MNECLHLATTRMMSDLHRDVKSTVSTPRRSVPDRSLEKPNNSDQFKLTVVLNRSRSQREVDRCLGNPNNPKNPKNKHSEICSRHLGSKAMMHLQD